MPPGSIISPVPAIVIQSTVEGYRSVRTALINAGLTEDLDFIVLDSDCTFKHDYVVSGLRQILVVGTEHGDERPAISFVNEMKERNKDLDPWFFSRFHSRAKRGTYARIVNYNPTNGLSRFENLAAEIKTALGR